MWWFWRTPRLLISFQCFQHLQDSLSWVPSLWYSMGRRNDPFFLHRAPENPPMCEGKRESECGGRGGGCRASEHRLQGASRFSKHHCPATQKHPLRLRRERALPAALDVLDCYPEVILQHVVYLSCFSFLLRLYPLSFSLYLSFGVFTDWPGKGSGSPSNWSTWLPAISSRKIGSESEVTGKNKDCSL